MSAPQVQTEAVDWEDRAARLERDVIMYRDQANRLSSERSRWERDVRACIHDDVWRDLLRYANGSMWSLANRDVAGLVYMVENLPDRVNAAKRDSLIGQASVARAWLDAVDTTEADGQLAEVQRLRAVMRVQGERLHAEHGVSGTGERCECPGCELFRESNTEGLA